MQQMKLARYVFVMKNRETIHIILKETNMSNYTNNDENIYNEKIDMTEQKCLHDSCPDCHGSGVKKNGEICVHWISCPCPRCTPRY